MCMAEETIYSLVMTSHMAQSGERCGAAIKLAYGTPRGPPMLLLLLLLFDSCRSSPALYPSSCFLQRIYHSSLVLCFIHQVHTSTH